MRTRRVVSGVLFALSASCAGGGGCSGCGGGPIPGGFPQESVVANGGSLRVTRTGLDFIATNFGSVATSALGKSALTFDIPQSNQSISVPILPDPTVTLCNGGPKPTQKPPECVAEIDIGGAKLKVDGVTPNVLRLTGTLPVQLQSLPVRVDYGVTVDLKAGLGQSPSCNGGTPKVTPKNVPVVISIPIVEETIAPRKGYAKLDIANAVIDPRLTSDDAVLCWDNCASAIQPICNAVAGFVKDRVFNNVIDGVKGQLKGALESFLCTKPVIGQTPICPTGSQPNGDKSKCMYSTRPTECVPIALGIETRLDLSSALSSFSPGTNGGFNLVLAGGGDLDPAPGQGADNVGYAGHTPNGLTLGLLGGTTPSPTSACAPQAKLTAPTGIPRPDELRMDAPPGWPAATPKPDLGLAISGRFFEYALGTAYNSGMLCLNVTTETLPAIQSGLISVLAPSLPKLTLEQGSAQVALVTKPKKPPKVKIGKGTDVKTDPLILVELPEFGLEFYVWSYDRFIRIFALAGDLTLPINLSTAKDPKKNPNGGLLVSLGEIQYKNAVATGNELLLEDAPSLASGISSVIGSISNQIAGAIPPFDLSSALSALGLGLDIPANGIVKLTKGSDDFVALFGKLKLAPKTATKFSPMVLIESKEVDPEGLTFKGADRARLPVLHVLAQSGASSPEYSYAIDNGTRSSWVKGEHLRVQTDDLFMQGKHVLHVWARSGDDPDSEDPESADVPFTIDVLPPRVEMDGTSLRARDIVSTELSFRTTRTDGTTTPWQPMASKDGVSLAALPSGIASAEVRDEEGNVALVAPSPTAIDDSVGCASTSQRSNGSGPIASLLALLGFVVLRRKHRATADGCGAPKRRP